MSYMFRVKKKKNSDYYDDINGDIFRERMAEILPRLKPKSVVVMDNAFYHSVKIDNTPSKCTPKADINKWLTDKRKVLGSPMVILELLLMVKYLKS